MALILISLLIAVFVAPKGLDDIVVTAFLAVAVVALFLG